MTVVVWRGVELRPVFVIAVGGGVKVPRCYSHTILVSCDPVHSNYVCINRHDRSRFSIFVVASIISDTSRHMTVVVKTKVGGRHFPICYPTFPPVRHIRPRIHSWIAYY